MSTMRDAVGEEEEDEVSDVSREVETSSNEDENGNEDDEDDDEEDEMDDRVGRILKCGKIALAHQSRKQEW